MKISTIGALSASILACTAFPISHAASISGQGTWEATLQGRDLDGDFSNGFEAYYDTVLDITWLANANYAGTPMIWADAKAWAAGLNPYGSGITGWRLPDTDPVNGVSYNYSYTYAGSTDLGNNISAPGTVYAGSTGSEMAHMFYNTLGNLAYYDTSGSGPQADWGLTNTGPFSNVLSGYYRSATEESALLTSGAWGFGFGNGAQLSFDKSSGLLAWAVHAGDVGAAAVPVPAAAWLFASGLVGLMVVSRKRRRC